MIRTAKKTDHTSGKTEKVLCPFRFPIVREADLTFSYFDGKISGTNIPVYYLAGKGIPEQGTYVQGETLKGGLMIFTDLGGGERISSKDMAHDLTIHEGIHHHSTPKDGEEYQDDLDFDANADTPEPAKRDLLRQKDELRAYLVQMMYGNYPHVALDSVLMVELGNYTAAKGIVKAGLDKMLRGDPVKRELYLAGRFKTEDLSDDELRRFAYDLFLKAGL
jgi:hypothetical protein